MGVYIKSMEMPFTCLTCDFHKCAGGVGDFCSLTKRRQFRFKNRPKGCPLIPVPEPHGALIDRDALLRTDRNIYGKYGVIGERHNFYDDEIIDAPTIIPAEEVYGQYTDTAGNYHWCGTHSGEHIIKAEEDE